MDRQKLIKAFQERYSGIPVLVKSPGRINLIGEHTDYNLGFVMPAAINRFIFVGAGTAKESSSVYSIDTGEEYSFSVTDNLKPVLDGGWKNYVIGVIHQIKAAGYTPGNFNMVITGNIPMGSGLSSSAALENGVGFAVNELFDLGISRLELLKISQLAEHNFAGVRCGIMDQFASMMGSDKQAIRLDCKTLAYNYFPVQFDDYSFVICNSNVHHSLAGSEYNVRREQCEEGVRILQALDSSISSLRDVELNFLKENEKRMDKQVFKRCSYVLEENSRVALFGLKLEENDPIGAGNVLLEGHNGLKDKYEVSCEEIDFLVEKATSYEECTGARMMGGGFGGCTINLVKSDRVDEFISKLGEAYKKNWNKEMTPISIEISDGVNLFTE